MVYDLVADGDALPRGAVVILFNNRIVYPVVEQQYQLFVLVSVRIADDVLDGPLAPGSCPRTGPSCGGSL